MAFRKNDGRDRDRRRDDEPKPEWIPKTDVGRKVKSKEITSVEEIFDKGRKILEAGIVDELLPDLETETLEVNNTQRMTKNGRKSQFRAVVLVGDRKGHVGIGVGKSEEVKPAIEFALNDAKRNISAIPLGCGSWECGCGTRHSLPIKVIGKHGSVEVTLKPAPLGLGLAANKVVRKVLSKAGVRDVWSFSRGHTENVYNSAMAVMNALRSLNEMRYVGDWSERGKAAEAKEAAAAPAAEEKAAE